MTSTTASASARALEHCDSLIVWYTSQKGRQRFLDSTVQVAIILAAALTAYAAAIELPKWLTVAAAVTTTAVTGLSTSFRFRAKYVNFASAAERLKWLKLRFEIRSADTPKDPRLLEDLVNGMEAIVSAELSEWREGLLAGDIAGRKVT